MDFGCKKGVDYIFASLQSLEEKVGDEFIRAYCVNEPRANLRSFMI